MNQITDQPSVLSSLGAKDVLNEILRQGAQRMLSEAVEAEVEEWVAARRHLRSEPGRQQVVRNGHLPRRDLLTPLGPVEVHQPRVYDRRSEATREQFRSALLPPYLRKTKSLEALLPWLYLRGISTGDFSPALAALLGPQAPGLSANTITRLKAVWSQEYQDWNRRDLNAKTYVYVWADGIHFNIRLGEQDRICILVLMGATAEGKKELIAVVDGYRESTQSWYGLLLSCQERGLKVDPKLATADGALGFWAAMRKVWPTCREQRCWVHKTRNVLDKLPTRLHPAGKQGLHQIWMAPSRVEAEKAFDLFLKTYQAKYPQAAVCLEKDREALLAFYDFPAEHWVHLRTTNPIESTFATVRLRTAKTKGCGSPEATLTMVFKLAQGAEGTWRLLNGALLLPEVIAGVKFTDGVKATGEKPSLSAA